MVFNRKRPRYVISRLRGRIMTKTIPVFVKEKSRPHHRTEFLEFLNSKSVWIAFLALACIVFQIIPQCQQPELCASIIAITPKDSENSTQQQKDPQQSSQAGDSTILSKDLNEAGAPWFLNLFQNFLDTVYFLQSFAESWIPEVETEIHSKEPFEKRASFLSTVNNDDVREALRTIRLVVEENLKLRGQIHHNMNLLEAQRLVGIADNPTNESFEGNLLKSNKNQSRIKGGDFKHWKLRQKTTLEAKRLQIPFFIVDPMNETIGNISTLKLHSEAGINPVHEKVNEKLQFELEGMVGLGEKAGNLSQHYKKHKSKDSGKIWKENERQSGKLLKSEFHCKEIESILDAAFDRAETACLEYLPNTTAGEKMSCRKLLEGRFYTLLVLKKLSETAKSQRETDGSQRIETMLVSPRSFLAKETSKIANSTPTIVLEHPIEMILKKVEVAKEYNQSKEQNPEHENETEGETENQIEKPPQVENATKEPCVKEIEFEKSSEIEILGHKTGENQENYLPLKEAGPIIIGKKLFETKDLPRTEKQSRKVAVLENQENEQAQPPSDNRIESEGIKMQPLFKYHSDYLKQKELNAKDSEPTKETQTQLSMSSENVEDELATNELVIDFEGQRYNRSAYFDGTFGINLKEPGDEVQALIDEGYTKNGFNEFISDLISIHRTHPDKRDPICKTPGRYLQNLPQASIVITFHNEAWSVILRTVHSILKQSPPHLLREIILVDDFSHMPHLKTQLDEYMAKYDKVKIYRSTKREGLIRGRLIGAAHASGPVLVFLDAHIEATEGWLEPLLDRIARNNTTVVCPVIDVLDSQTLDYIWEVPIQAVGGFDWSLTFTWIGIPEKERKRIGNIWEPVRSATMAGGLFAIDKEFFNRIGTYDPEFDIWGAEHLELSFKTWMCGGSLEIIPCSHVGHIYRIRSPYRWRTGQDTLRRNNIRLAEVWMDEYALFYYQSIGHVPIDIGDISPRVQLRQQLGCKSFRWFLETIYPQQVYPGKPLATGELRNIAQPDMCLDSMAETDQPPSVYKCHGMKRNQFWIYTDRGEIMQNLNCLDLPDITPELWSCHGNKGNQDWFLHPNSKLIQKQDSDLCLAMAKNEQNLVMEDCNPQEPRQHWQFEILTTEFAAQFNLTHDLSEPFSGR